MGTKKYKVIIVGGGPAGSMTALSLVNLRPELAGDILLLEAKAFPREKICGGGVSGRVTAFLEELGVPLQSLPKVSVKDFTVCFEDERYYPPFGNDKCFVARRSAFDSLLLEEAMRRGVEVRTSTPAVGAYRERKGVVVLDREGRSHHSEVLVGADGVNGRSRTWFGIPPGARRSLLLQTDFPRDPGYEPLQDSLVLDFSPPQFEVPGYVWFFPSFGDEGEPVVNAGISGGEFQKGGYARLREVFTLILDRHPDIKAMAPAHIHFKGYPEREYSPIQVNARQRVIFVGEQVGVDSFTGEGLSVCAGSAAIASREIVTALDKGDFSFRGYGLKLVRTDFFPLYVIGKTYWLQSNGHQPSLFFAMATRELPPDKRNVLDYYAAVFSGRDPGSVLYTPTFWGTVLRDIAGVLPGWRQRVSGTSSSRR
jgi:flavin-dependent dehydrogenase